MAKTNKEIMAEAREALRGNWGLAIGTHLVYGIFTSASGSIPGYGSVVGIILGGPMELGISIFTLNLARKKKAEFMQVFEGFNYFLEAMVAYLLMALYVLLWSLLLIIPGIVAALSYSQTFYILADKPKTKGVEALKISKQIMMGNKWKLFCLSWRFFGWSLLCVLTLGIGFIWLLPYIQVSLAGFYQEVKK